VRLSSDKSKLDIPTIETENDAPMQEPEVKSQSATELRGNSQPAHYVIRGGKEGKERLNLIATVMLPHTTQLLERVGLGEGMTCLDVGCGGGHVTLLMANLVGPRGKVVGIDADAQILALVQEDIEAAGVENVELRHLDAANSHDGQFDLVYARFLLTHLSNPQQCLQSMIAACKPGGVVAVEDIDFTGNFCHPPCQPYQRYTELYQQVVERKGGDPNIGPKLPGMLRQARLDDVQVEVVQPTHLDAERKMTASITMQRIASSVIAEGLASEEEIGEIIKGLNDAAADPELLMSVPRIFQTWGSKIL
jgi:2-polyprenyl-3-methyl-5-hydroxy-6-metoxy-1,4-benzoquinol methylase